ncbi:hypothetical protein BH11CYA1_BH11CYA1_20990 [soil metagenome]
MSCHANIIDYILALPPGAWFATQQVLNLGSREAIDQTLYRLVKCGYLTRIAWGVFTLRIKEQIYEPLAVAKYKAKIFKKRASIHGLALAKQLGLTEGEPPQQQFCVHGVSSTFQSIEGEITLKSHSARKIALEGTRLGETISALWFLGRQSCDSIAVELATRSLDDDELHELTQSAHRMPGWLMKLVRSTIGRPKRTIYSSESL